MYKNICICLCICICICSCICSCSKSRCITLVIFRSVLKGICYSIYRSIVIGICCMCVVIKMGLRLSKLCKVWMQKEELSNWANRFLSYGDFNWNSCVDSMLIVEVNAIHIQPLQARLTSRAHICGISSHQELPILDNDPKFGCKLNLVPSSFQSLLQ